MIGEISNMKYTENLQYLLASIPNNPEIKSVSIAAPTGVLATSITVLTSLLLAGNLPYFEMIGLNIIDYTKELIGAAAYLRITLNKLSMILPGIRKLVLLYYPDEYDYSFLISKFPNLKEVVFFVIFPDQSIHKEYLIEFLKNGITVHLLGGRELNDFAELYSELNVKSGYPFYIPNKVSAGHIAASEQLMKVIRRRSNNYIGPLNKEDLVDDAL